MNNPTTTNSKNILIKSIGDKLYTFFITKYGEQFKSLQLDNEKINKIVSVKLEKEKITKSKIPTIINTLQETINKIVVKKIYDMNNSNIIVNPKEKEINKSKINIVQPSLSKKTLDIDTNIFTNLINKQELIKELGEKRKTDIKLDLSLNDDLEKIKTEYKEKFPMRERKEDVNEIKTLIPKKILNFNIVVNSLERDRKTYSSPYHYKQSLDYLGKFKNITIKKITLINCIIKKTSQISRTPYITLNIKELKSEYYRTTQENSNIFCYLDLYKKQNDYLYYDCNNKSIEITSGIIIDGITISLHLPNGDLLEETYDSRKEDINEDKFKLSSSKKSKQLEIKSLDIIEEVDLNKELNLDLEGISNPKPQLKNQQDIKKRKHNSKSKNGYEYFNNQFIFNIEYEFTI